MTTEEEKAKELIENFSEQVGYRYNINGEKTPLIVNAKQCALICVEEILEAGKQYIVSQYFDDIFWQEVKSAIEKY